jgi:hypothetical protein
MIVRPHPNPMASQARHQSVSPQETFAPRNVVPQERGADAVAPGFLNGPRAGFWLTRISNPKAQYLPRMEPAAMWRYRSEAKCK